MKHHFHVVCGPTGSGRTSLIPPRRTTAFLYYDVATGNPLTEELFQHQCRAITDMAYQDRRCGQIPQESTVILDNADNANLSTRLVVFSAATGARWHCTTVWMIYREYCNIHQRILDLADRYYLFREQDVQSVLDAIPLSIRGTDTDHIPPRTGKLQWWMISRWRRGRPREGVLGRTKLRCFEAPSFRVLRRCIRRRLWRKWIRELLVMGRFAKRWKPRARWLLHKAYAPEGSYYQQAKERFIRETRLPRNKGGQPALPE